MSLASVTPMEDTKPFRVLLPTEMHDELRQRAEREDRSAAAVVRVALRRYFDEEVR
jgi:predicted DNA-binding protein